MSPTPGSITGALQEPEPIRPEGAPLPAGEEHQTEAVSSSRRRLIFFICAIALFMGSMDQTIVATALPRIGVALHARVNWLSWTITIYSLGQVVMLPLAGRIGDQIGRKRLIVICITVFTASSVACGLATNIYVLVPLRLVQSLGGGAIMPCATGVISDHFGTERDRAIGLFSSILPIGGVAGPVFGGLITQYWTWRGVFFVNLPIGIMLLVLVARYIPRTPPKRGHPLDFGGIALLAFTIVSGMLTITTLGEASASPTSAQVLLPGAAAIVLGWLFVRHVRRSPTPVIQPRLLGGHGFGMMNAINVLFGGAGFGFGVLIPLYAENRYHITTASAGTVLSGQAIAQVIFAAIAAMMIRRTGYRRPMFFGLLVIAASLVLLSIAPHGLPPYWWLEIFAMASGFGLGWVAPAANNATMSLAPDQVAAISGLRATFRSTGSIISVSTITAVLARSADPGIAQAHAFWVLAALLVVTSGLTFFIPERRERESW